MSRLIVVIIAGILAAPASASATSFRVENDRGIAQYSYWQLNGDESWFATDGFGVADITVAPGDVVRFTRTISGPPKFPPPEGYAGQSYTVPDPVPSEVEITLPSTGPMYKPDLSDAERWVIGKANERREQRGLDPLKVSTTLAAAADSMARLSVLEDRWPPSFLTAYQQDFGWPSAGGGALDNPGSDPAKAIGHWTDGSQREDLLMRPDFNAIGVGEGGGWFIAQLSECPTDPAASRCGMTNDTGDPKIDLPPPFAPDTVFPSGRSAGSARVADNGKFSTSRRLFCPPGAACLVKIAIVKDGSQKVGGSRYTVPGDSQRAVASKLNKKGRGLLKRQGKLTARLEITVTRDREVLRRTLRAVLTPRPRG